MCANVSLFRGVYNLHSNAKLTLYRTKNIIVVSFHNNTLFLGEGDENRKNIILLVNVNSVRKPLARISVCVYMFLSLVLRF